MAEAIKEKLTKAFNPLQLEVQDQSHLHVGHGGAAEHKASFPDKKMTAETHIHVVIVAESFVELGSLAKHRAVIEVIAEEIDLLHAFSLEASTGVQPT